jgi:hypothetical protein
MSYSWFRLYSEVLNDPKVQCLSGEHFKTWINILCIASKNHGVLPDMEALQFLLRATPEAVTEALAILTQAKLLTVTKNQHGEVLQPHNWVKRQYKSDTSADRVKRHREKAKTVTCNVTVTPPDTDTDTDTDTEKKESCSANAPPTTKPRSGSSRGSRLTEDWALPPDWKEWAYSHLSEYGLTPDDGEVERQADAFRDYWAAKTGAGATKANWQATWRNWIRRWADAENKRIQRQGQIDAERAERFGGYGR